jgi:hypothetical protein
MDDGSIDHLEFSLIHAACLETADQIFFYANQQLVLRPRLQIGFLARGG